MATSSVGQAERRPIEPEEGASSTEATARDHMLGETAELHLSKELVTVGLDATYQIDGLVGALLNEIERTSKPGEHACRGIVLRIHKLNASLMTLLGDEFALENPRQIAVDVMGTRDAWALFPEQDGGQP